MPPILECLAPWVQLGQAAALYCRVSTADQTCARQQRDLRAYVRKAGYEIVGVWRETGSGAKDSPGERKKILALAQVPEIDIILVTELTRWGRSMLNLFHALQDLQYWDDPSSPKPAGSSTCAARRANSSPR